MARVVMQPELNPVLNHTESTHYAYVRHDVDEGLSDIKSLLKSKYDRLKQEHGDASSEKITLECAVQEMMKFFGSSVKRQLPDASEESQVLLINSLITTLGEKYISSHMELLKVAEKKKDSEISLEMLGSIKGR